MCVEGFLKRVYLGLDLAYFPAAEVLATALDHIQPRQHARLVRRWEGMNASGRRVGIGLGGTDKAIGLK
jgi:hypothetical protein